jgi:hypothetical protein
MIDAQEHRYDDDPAIGPADVRTRLSGASYFFLGNGLIQAAVQFAPEGEGTPLGLLLMDPDRLAKKREALTMDAASGLAGTSLEIEAGGASHKPAARELRVSWEEREGLPAVRACWPMSGGEVEELFYCPDPAAPVLVREVTLPRGVPAGRALVRTAVPGTKREAAPRPAASGVPRVLFRYILDASRRKVELSVLEEPPDEAPARAYWKGLAAVTFGDPRLDRFFRSARCQLPALVSASGRQDGGVWQYNREWVRDQAVIAPALAMIGETGRARTMMARFLDDFVTDDGDTVDSSQRRGPDEAELDQNGYLLMGLSQYALWTGDLDLIRGRWGRIAAAAEFPLRPVFRHEPSGLLMNRREYWERHRIHGIATGLEQIYQTSVSAGLEAGAGLARLTGHEAEAARWTSESLRLRRAMLEDRAFRMLDNRGFIKRRGPDGRVQETIIPGPEAGLHPSVPLAGPGPHFINPDTSAVLPVVYGLVPPESPLAVLTLSSMEALWSQSWPGGGYGRYHVSSEPDSPGPWPFASLFVARAAVECGEFGLADRVLEWLDSVPGAAAGSWFEFYGSRPSPPCPQVGIIPWTWAEMIQLMVHHMLGLRPGEGGLSVRPRLRPGLGPVRADWPYRGGRLRLEIEPDSEGRPPRVRIDGSVQGTRP